MTVVSLVIPCYNAEKYINDAIDSVLSQTSKDIELIIVNDGSTDSSEEIILSRRHEIEAVLAAFKYIRQDNAGVAGACQTGFKNATGQYFMLLDADDCLLPYSIEKQKDFLDNNEECAAVRTNGYYTYIEEKDEKKYMFESGSPEANSEITVWEDVFLGEKHSLSGAYMIRMSVLDEIYPNRDIYISRYGQNLQFLLAASYHRKVGFIDQPLMKYNIRKDSMTHEIVENQENREIDFLEGFKEIRSHLVNNCFDEEEKEEYLRKNDILYERMYLQIANKYKDKKLADESYERLRTLTGDNVSKPDKLLFHSTKYPVYQQLIKLINRIRRHLK